MGVAVVVGAGGQDGALLSRLLAARGDRVVPVCRPARAGDTDITRFDDVAALVAAERPDEVYFLAAVQHSSEDPIVDQVDLAHRSYAVNTLAPVHFLEAIATRSPRTRLFYAASSHVFGPPTTAVQNESTPLRPTSVYGISKAAGVLHCRAYRERGVFASVGILYNHESPLRRPAFVSSKVVGGAARVRRGEDHEVTVGSLAAGADWGYAPDYVEAMTRLLAADAPDDFVVATGELHTVEDLASTAFALAGLDWRRHVRERPGVLTRPGQPLVGDATRLRERTGWRPSVDFRGMVAALLAAEGVPVTGR